MGIFDVFTGKTGGRAAVKAAGQQVAGLQDANQLLQGGIGAVNSGLAPYTESGVRGLGAYENALGLNGEQGRAQALDQFQAGPGYQFQLGEGVRALDNSASARGMLLSGAGQRDLAQFGQGLANQEWGSHLDRLGGLAQNGQQATMGGLDLTTGLRRGVAGNLADIGTARATGTIGKANAKQAAVSDLLGFAGSLFGFM